MDARDQALAELVGRALEESDGAHDAAVEAICAEHPEFAEDVRRALDVARRLPTLQTAGVGGDHRVGSVVAGRYRLSERTGVGVAGIVYGGIDVESGSDVSIKILHRDVLSKAASVARFEHDTRLLWALEHRALVRVHDRGATEEGAPFLVTEPLDGVLLSDVLDEARAACAFRGDTGWLSTRLGLEGAWEPCFLRQAATWVARLAGGLAAAHRAGLVHGAVDPSRILVRGDGMPVLMDFGLAAPREPSVDLMGLAAVLRDLVTTRESVDRLPRPLRAILDRGLAGRQRDRYPSAAAMERDLSCFLTYRAVEARSLSIWARAFDHLRVALPVRRSRRGRGRTA
ncbi:MAG: protein kinase [Planctomycetota bacterium]